MYSMLLWTTSKKHLLHTDGFKIQQICQNCLLTRFEWAWLGLSCSCVLHKSLIQFNAKTIILCSNSSFPCSFKWYILTYLQYVSLLQPYWTNSTISLLTDQWQLTPVWKGIRWVDKEILCVNLTDLAGIVAHPRVVCFDYNNFMTFWHHPHRMN